MSLESLEEFKAQRPDYFAVVGSANNGAVTFNERHGYFIDALLIYLTEVETRLTDIETRLSDGGL